MAAVDSFALLYREISRSCSCYMETLALVGALYTGTKAVTLLHECYSFIRLHLVPRLIYPPDLLHQYGQWAVVSGASDAVARAYTEELARNGVSIVLIGSDAGSVSHWTGPISEAHEVQVVVVRADFRQGPKACDLIREAIGDKDVGFVVNCLDWSRTDSTSFHETPESELWDVVGQSTCAPSLITRLALPGMAARRRGAVVNIAPGRFSGPWARNAALSACAAFLDHLSHSLHSEYGGCGIFVQSLVPFRVASQAGQVGSVGSWLVPDPDVYARHAVSTLGVSHRTTGYWPHTLQLGLMQWIPDWIWVFGVRMMCRVSC